MRLEGEVRAHRARQAEWIEPGGEMSADAVGPDQMVDAVLQQGPVEVQLSRGAVRRGRPFSGGRGGSRRLTLCGDGSLGSHFGRGAIRPRTALRRTSFRLQKLDEIATPRSRDFGRLFQELGQQAFGEARAFGADSVGIEWCVGAAHGVSRGLDPAAGTIPWRGRAVPWHPSSYTWGGVRSIRLSSNSRKAEACTGLIKCPSKPASSARRRSSSRPQPVSATSTIVTAPSSCRKRRATSYPCSLGMPISKQHRLRLKARGHFECLEAVESRLHLRPHELQQHAHAFGSVAIVVNHQDAVAGAKSSRPILGGAIGQEDGSRREGQP